MTYEELIGKNLKEVRLQRGYTVQQVADYMNMAKSTISLYENGKRQIASSILFRLLDFYNVDDINGFYLKTSREYNKRK